MQVVSPQNDRKVHAGAAVRSIKGHDRHRLYLVIKRVGDLLYLSDGDYRPLSKTKKKNLKHVMHVSDLMEAETLELDLTALKYESEQNNYIRRLLKQLEDKLSEKP